MSRVLVLIALLGCGINAGVFFAFSTFVMKALGRLPAHQGIAAMQSINVAVINPWVMTALLGTAASCGVLAIAALLRWSTPGAPLRLAAGVVFLVGTIAVTRACHIPRNDAIAAVGPDGAEAARLWSRYLAEWTAWNHVRTAAALIAAGLLAIALLRDR